MPRRRVARLSVGLALGAACSAGCSEAPTVRPSSSQPSYAGGGASGAAGAGGQLFSGGAGAQSPIGQHGGAGAGAASCAGLQLPGAELVHPGGLHSRSNLERMRYQVRAGQEPWSTSFERLASDVRARSDYVVQGDASWTTAQRGGAHGPELESDATAAYLNALMWAITQDEAHAEKSVEIFNTWKNLTGFIAGGTPALDAGLYAYKLVEAAELIRSTYDGWAPEDLKAFQDMLVYPGYSSTAVPDTLSDSNGTFYWRIHNGDPGRHGNQDMIAWRAMLSMGVFLDNRLMFERALRYFKGEPHLAEDLPYASGPSTSGAQISDNPYFTSYEPEVLATTPDYGFNGVLAHYVWENGQLQESSRDQQHALFGLGIAAGIAEVAWNQGDDVWNYLDQRLLKGFEFTARYNASYLQGYPDQSTPWEPSGAELLARTDRTGRWRSKAVNPHFESDFDSVSRGDFPGKRPMFEQAVAHFQGRMGLPPSATLWTERARDLAIERYGQEANGFSLDHPGWGGLTFRRPAECAGDPISGFAHGRPLMTTPVVPAAVSAAHYDFFPAAGEGHTYHDRTSGNSGALYRADDVDLACDEDGEVVVSMIEDGEWLSYTLQVPRPGAHAIELSYRAPADGAAVLFRIDARDATGPIELPAAGGRATTRRLAGGVDVRAGVQALRIVVIKATPGLELRSFRLVPE